MSYKPGAPDVLSSLMVVTIDSLMMVVKIHNTQVIDKVITLLDL